MFDLNVRIYQLRLLSRMLFRVISTKNCPWKKEFTEFYSVKTAQAWPVLVNVTFDWQVFVLKFSPGYQTLKVHKVDLKFMLWKFKTVTHRPLQLVSSFSKKLVSSWKSGLRSQFIKSVQITSDNDITKNLVSSGSGILMFPIPDSLHINYKVYCLHNLLLSLVCVGTCDWLEPHYGWNFGRRVTSGFTSFLRLVLEVGVELRARLWRSWNYPLLSG